MDEKTRPTEIAPTEDATRLRIEWADGHESVFSPFYLRVRCPCAMCVDEYTGDRILDPATIPDSVYPLEIKYVGRYALRFEWSDMHDTGIYPFEMLRRICPCEECNGSGSGERDAR